MFLKAVIEDGQIKTKLGTISIEDLEYLPSSNFIEIPPLHYNSEGIRGQWSVDDDWLYVCTDSNLWLRFPGSKSF